MDVSNGKVVSRTRACLFSSILSGVLFARFYLWNTGLITEFSKSVLPFRSPSPTLSPRKSCGSFSSSLFYWWFLKKLGTFILLRISSTSTLTLNFAYLEIRFLDFYSDLKLVFLKCGPIYGTLFVQFK